VTQQDLDNATQNNLSAAAQVKASQANVETAKAQIEAAQAAVQAAQAAVETAKYNLGFTRLTSPIDGVAGMAASQVGTLVGPASMAVTTVSTLDPIRANFTVSEQEYLGFTHQSGIEVSKLPLDLILSDGSTYAKKGRFFFADREVNQSTGSIQLTALFPNPGNILRPGQYAKVRAVTGTSKGRCSSRSAPSPNCKALSGGGGRRAEQGEHRHRQAGRPRGHDVGDRRRTQARRPRGCRRRAEGRPRIDCGPASRGRKVIEPCRNSSSTGPSWPW
jgi:multidrug efflux pump subunit AcrA (membrane-fusion protein)